MLVGRDHSSYAIYNALKKEYPISHILLEDATSRKAFIKKRIKKLGILTVFGQALFQKIIVPILKKESEQRVKEIVKKNKLSFEAFEAEKLIKIGSVNSDGCIAKLQEIAPDIIIVNGTRIISKKVLNCVDATFINTHAGMTPLYRGIHGGYWSKINNDGHCGVSVHLVDPGIDTGGILFQDLIETTADDNFISYTYLQLTTGITLMKKAIDSILEGKMKVVTNNLDSKFWTHPTFWFYIKHRIVNKVK